MAENNPIDGPNGEHVFGSSVWISIRPFLKRKLNNKVRNDAKIDASDIVQEAMTTAFLNKSQFAGKSRSQFYCWVLRIAHHMHLDSVRFWKCLRRDVDRETDNMDVNLVANTNFKAHEKTPDEIDEEICQMLELISKLPKDEAHAIRLRHVERCSVAEISEQMNRTTCSVAGLLKRGLARLRKRIS